MSNFTTVYAAVIITDGESAYIRKGESFNYLAGVKVKGDAEASPRRDITQEIAKITGGINFGIDWIRYIGTTIHCDEYSPSIECKLERQFVVMHYWLPLDGLPGITKNLINDDFIKVDLQTMADNENNTILYADSLAAQQVLDIRNNVISE